MALQYDLEAAVALQESLAIEQAAVKEARDQERAEEARRRVAEYDEGNVGTAAAMSNHQGLLRQLRDYTDRMFLHDRQMGRMVQAPNEQDAQPFEHTQHTAAQRAHDRTVSQLRRERREPEAKDMVLLTREAQATYEARLWTDIATKEGELRPGSAAGREYRSYAQDAREEAERTTKQRIREGKLHTRQPPMDLPLADLLAVENVPKDIFHNQRAARYERDHVANLPPERHAAAIASLAEDHRQWVDTMTRRMRVLEQADAYGNPCHLAALMEKVAYACASESFERWLQVAMTEERYHGKTAVHADAILHRDVANRAFEAVYEHLFGPGNVDHQDMRDFPQYAPTCASAAAEPQSPPSTGAER